MNKILQLLGLIKKANKLITGEEFVVKGIKDKKVFFVFLATDAGVNTTKKIKNKTNYYNVPLSTCFTSEELSKAIGKTRKVIGITDRGFASSIIKKGCEDYGKKDEEEGRKNK